MKNLDVAVVVDSIPSTLHGGGGITSYMICRSLRDNGHRITVIILQSQSQGEDWGKSDFEQIDHLKSIGLEVKTIDVPVTRPRGFLAKVFPTLDNYFTTRSQAQPLDEYLGKREFDAIVTYHWGALAAVYKLSGIPKFALVGDPLHLPTLFRREFSSRHGGGIGAQIRLLTASIITANRQKAMMRILLGDCSLSGAFAAHHAKELAVGLKNPCRYFCTPTPDPFEKQVRRNLQNTEKLKIVHIGHLQGIATLSGIEILMSDVVPLLDQELGSSNYEIHLIGGFFEQIPKDMKESIGKHPSLKVRGQINPADDEFLSAQILIVPTPIKLGIRVRIITAFSFGCCVVAHQANKSGIPELISEENCLLSPDGAGLARACIRIARDPTLRQKLETASRLTYEEKFSINTAGLEIVHNLEQIVDETKKFKTAFAH